MGNRFELPEPPVALLPNAKTAIDDMSRYRAKQVSKVTPIVTLKRCRIVMFMFRSHVVVIPRIRKKLILGVMERDHVQNRHR